MTHKAITLKFVLPTALAIALGIMISIGVVRFTDKYAVPIDQADANYSVASAAELLRCQTLTCSFRAFAFCFPV